MVFFYNPYMLKKKRTNKKYENDNSAEILCIIRDYLNAKHTYTHTHMHTLVSHNK